MKAKIPKTLSKQTELDKVIESITILCGKVDALTQATRTIKVESAPQQDGFAFWKEYSKSVRASMANAPWEYNEIPKHKPRKWRELLTFQPEWSIAFDPHKLFGLACGATVELTGLLNLSFNGLVFGSIPREHYSELKSHRECGAKFYAFMRSDRRITIKVGYPQ